MIKFATADYQEVMKRKMVMQGDALSKSGGKLLEKSCTESYSVKCNVCSMALSFNQRIL